LTYYQSESPIVQAIAAVRERKQGPISMAVVGLGTGTLACYFQPGDTLQFFEIDPAVIRIATDPNRFTYLSSCAAAAEIIVGDARLTLADAGRGPYDILIVDAFSSDAIPIHLLTREAMAIYLDRLAPNGLIVMHVSNRHMELASVVAGIAEANGLVSMLSWGTRGEDDASYKFSATVLAVARNEEDFGNLSNSEDWERTEADEGQRVWTDDYSNVLGAMLRQLRQ
jgi:spermidine synthase